MRDQYPTAWIDRESKTVASVSSPDLPVSEVATPAAVTTAAAETTGTSGDLMLDARRAMTLGEISRAIQIYTKILQQPANEYQREAQEFLALARERNGQVAHANHLNRLYHLHLKHHLHHLYHLHHLFHLFLMLRFYRLYR